MDLKPASKELERARRCIERMKSSKTYDEYDEAWSDFLSRIENVFNRIKIAAEHHKQYPGFSSKTNQLRSSDELLVYLKQARNTAHHGIADTSRHVPGGLSIQPATPGGVVAVKDIVIDGKGNASFTPISPLKVSIYPSTIEAVSCWNRGITYQPPSKHLGDEFHSKSPIILAEHGVTFYHNFLLSAEEVFLKA